MTDSGLLMEIRTRGPIKWPEALAEGYLIGQRVRIPINKPESVIIAIRYQGWTAKT